MVALDAVLACLGRGAALESALERDRRFETLPSRDRALARLLAAETCRRLGQVDDLIGRCLARALPSTSAVTGAILRLGVTQLLFLDVAAHAAVATSVDLAHARARAHAPLVNAVLRRLSREGPVMVAQQDAARLNTPDWLYLSWQAAWGERRARAIASCHGRRAPLDLSVAGDAGSLARRLGGHVLPTGGVRLVGAGRVTDLPGYAAGSWWVQDAAASLPARLLGEVAGLRVLDLCAAPGGKTAQLAASGARVTALDISAKRMTTLADNMARLGLEVETVIADGASWRPSVAFDAVLLDAPCSATGTIRRHPEIAWTRSASELPRLAARQKELLAGALACVRPGGVLVYAVCSLQPEEGEAHLDDLPGGCRHEPLAPAECCGLDEAVDPRGCLRTLPCHMAGSGGMDGFFAMRLRRSGEAATPSP